jgi:hypothetical protein
MDCGSCKIGSFAINYLFLGSYYNDVFCFIDYSEHCWQRTESAVQLVQGT